MTASLRDAAQMALEALEIAREAYEAWGNGTVKIDAAIESLRAALALPDEPVAWTLTETLNKRETTTTGYLWFNNPVNCCWTPLYATPQPAPAESHPALVASIEARLIREQRLNPAPVERKPLSDDEILAIGKTIGNRVDAYDDGIEFARAIEAAHGIKGAA